MFKELREEARSHYDESREYHNFEHALHVGGSVLHLMDVGEDRFGESDYRAALIAAWFHDVGYADSPEQHEERSAEIAVSACMDRDVSEHRVKQLILDTEFGKPPDSTLGEYLADADVASFGKSFDGYWEDREAVRQEMYPDMPELWVLGNNVGMLLSHEYWTPIARQKWGDQKQENLNRLIERSKELKDGGAST